MMQRMTGRTLFAIVLATAGVATVTASEACETSKAEKPKVAKPPIDPSGPRETAILAGGCFWGMENVLRDAPGIVSIEVGYAGGKSAHVSYEDVSSGETGHAESVR